MPETKPLRFDKVLNLGHVLQALTITIGLAGSVIYGVQRDTETRLMVASITADVQELKPRVASLEASNTLSTERLTNHANSMRSLRDDLTTTTNELRRSDTQLQADLNITRVEVATLKGARVTSDN